MAERILIVGGGIAGLTLRRALSGGPWQVDLAESRGGGPGRLGAGLAVQPNAMRALSGLGLGTAVRRAGAVLDSFQYRDQHGGLLCDVDLATVWAGVGPFVGISRQALHDRLAAAGPTEGAVTAVTCSDGGPRVSFGDGRAARYDLVVGADGINSVVRRCLGHPPAPVGAGQTAWRSLAPIRMPAVSGVQFWLGADRFFGLCPAGPRLTYGFGNVAGIAAVDPVRGRRSRLIARFAGFGGPVQEYLAAVGRDEDIHCAPVRWLPEVAGGADRVVLIGDAAHAMSPMMGQGGAMAIEDAVVLAEELRRDQDIPAALARFDRRRRARVDWVRTQSAALGDLLRLPPAVRDQALRTRGVSSFRERFGPLTAPP